MRRLDERRVQIDRSRRFDNGSVGGGNGGLMEWGGGGGVNEGIRLLCLRMALHTMKLTAQNSFGESLSQSKVRLSTLRELNSLQALHVHPVFVDELSNGSDEKSVKQKIA